MVEIQSQTPFLKGAGFSQLQDVRQTKAYAGFMEKLGWKIEDSRQITIFIKKLPLLPFSVLKILRYQLPLNEKAIEKLIKKHKAVIIKKEPFAIEKQKNNQVYFKIQPNNQWPLTPTKTIWLNPQSSEKELTTKMKPKTRYNLKRVTRNKLKVKIISGEEITKKQLTDFYNLWSKNKPHNLLFKPRFHELESLIESFGNQCFLVIIYHQSSLMACSLQLTSKNMVFYWHNGSTEKGKQLFAPTLCVWEAIMESKKRKMIVFDFEGIWDERYPKLNQGWKGFARFKQGFVGN